MMEKTAYHKSLRVLALAGALALVFQSGLISDTTARLSDGTELYLANAIGVSVGVAPTELNQITAKLTEQRQQLDAREASLNERELAIGLNGDRSSDRTTFILSAMVFFLLCLIVLNYALDFARLVRMQKEMRGPISGYVKT